VDDLHACATLNDDNLLTVQVLNTTKKPLSFSLHIDKQVADVTITANALQTIRVQLD
jgi:glucosylceramidase